MEKQNDQVIDQPGTYDQAAHCPSCDQPAIRNGKTIICANCGATWRFTREGNKIEKFGEFDELKNRVSAIEEKIGRPAIPVQVPEVPPEDPTVVDLTDLDENEGDI